MNITPIQRAIMLLVFAGLIGWLIYYWWMLAGGQRRNRRPTLPGNMESQASSRLDQAMLALQQFQQQPILESARVNFLRRLDAMTLHDVILLALSAVNYVVRMDEPALDYELPPMDIAEPSADFVLTETVDAPLSKPSYRGRLTQSMKDVMDNLEPAVEVGNVFTADGRSVLVSIQVEGNGYSRHGFNRLTEACELEKRSGLLICLGTSSVTSPPISPVVILTGGELLSILDGLE